MNFTDWTIRNEVYQSEKKSSRDALFTIGNGYFGIRGFFEEDTEGVDSLGGIYMAGVFGKGNTPVWEGMSRELCNVPNVLRLVLKADGEIVKVDETCLDFVQEVDLYHGIYNRSYIYQTEGGKRIRVTMERFASRKTIFQIGQKVKIEALDGLVSIQIQSLLDTDIRNLNQESCEPIPIQPGRNHMKEREIGDNRITVLLDDDEETVVSFAQYVTAYINREALKGMNIKTPYACGTSYEAKLSRGQNLELEKIICAGTSGEGVDISQRMDHFLSDMPSYRDVRREHDSAWEEKWARSDIKIGCNTPDQIALRFNIFHLLAVCPEHTDRLSIGARGLSGEMYEGCVFWDNEIFKLPFFIYTNPDAAKKLLIYRYHTLDAARRHAKRNWLEGAMYPWQASEKGIEQTPYNVGAFYAIHIVADIAYAIKQYWNITGDDQFILDYGAEILIETARFFADRCDFRPEDGKYEIRAVRGPNEYDVYVNNNVYTNTMAAENLKTAYYALQSIERKYPEGSRELIERLNVTEIERNSFLNISDQLVIPFDMDLNLYLEDDQYLNRRPLDMKKAKPTGKRIIDSTIPYEALPLYQVTKQSDVILLMNLLPEKYTRDQMEAAYQFYEPKTAHDSSLSYAPHGILAARMNWQEEAMEYFRKSAYLDIEDRQLNTISGLHFANFGGTWQMVCLGYGGITEKEGTLHLNPHIPCEWNTLEFEIIYRGRILHIHIGMSDIRIEISAGSKLVLLNVEDETFTVGQTALTINKKRGQ